MFFDEARYSVPQRNRSLMTCSFVITLNIPVPISDMHWYTPPPSGTDTARGTKDGRWDLVYGKHLFNAVVQTQSFKNDVFLPHSLFNHTSIHGPAPI